MNKKTKRNAPRNYPDGNNNLYTHPFLQSLHVWSIDTTGWEFGVLGLLIFIFRNSLAVYPLPERFLVNKQ
jgi:hypothetical protein